MMGVDQEALLRTEVTDLRNQHGLAMSQIRELREALRQQVQDRQEEVKALEASRSVSREQLGVVTDALEGIAYFAPGKAAIEASDALVKAGAWRKCELTDPSPEDGAHDSLYLSHGAFGGDWWIVEPRDEPTMEVLGLRRAERRVLRLDLTDMTIIELG